MKKISIILFAAICTLAACKPDKKPVDNTTQYSDINNTYGFGVLNNVKGIWNGGVTSTTALGSYPEWIVDFRPIAENQISAKNELDTVNDIFMSFFVAKYNNEYRVCFRNGGSFAGNTRVSYFLADSVSETSSQSYYHFSEILKGKDRAYTEVIRKGDSLIIQSFTNRYNSQPTATLHMRWAAKLQDTTSAQDAVTTLTFPKKTLRKDFSSSFEGLTETVFYNNMGDPYGETEQPYVGRTTVTYSYAPTFTPDPGKKVFIMITTQPLISGFNFNVNNLKFRSRYVILNANDTDFTFNYMHPGTYYLYALYDADGNQNFSSGDWVSAANTTFTLPASGTVNASAQINFVVP